MKSRLKLGGAFLLGCLVTLQGLGAEKKIILIAGGPSHGPGDHEFRAGCLLLQTCLDRVGGITSVVYSNGWPTRSQDGKTIDDESAFAGVDAIFIYSDGGGGHPAIKPARLKLVDDLVERGIGVGCAHYAVEVPKGEPGEAMLRWTGGYFETFWSVNPHWDAAFEALPSHPITRGVKPFKIRDEWYYHMRFPEGMKNVTPILTALPPDSTRGREGSSSSHGGNPSVQARRGMPEHLMWAFEGPRGGRGFGFTGGHYHRNWGDENFRRTILNTLLWIAKVEVPATGVESELRAGQLEENLDPKGSRK